MNKPVIKVAWEHSNVVLLAENKYIFSFTAQMALQIYYQYTSQYIPTQSGVLGKLRSGHVMLCGMLICRSKWSWIAVQANDKCPDIVFLQTWRSWSWSCDCFYNYWTMNISPPLWRRRRLWSATFCKGYSYLKVSRKATRSLRHGKPSRPPVPPTKWGRYYCVMTTMYSSYKCHQHDVSADSFR